MCTRIHGPASKLSVVNKNYVTIFFFLKIEKLPKGKWCMVQNSVDNGHAPLLSPLKCVIYLQ